MLNSKLLHAFNWNNNELYCVVFWYGKLRITSTFFLPQIQTRRDSSRLRHDIDCQTSSSCACVRLRYIVDNLFKMEWPNSVSLEFLELYKNEPVIWNPQHSSYKDRNLINEAWKRIEQSISVETSVMELKGKKESLMATFRKVSNKVKVSDDDYRPPWFAYEFMDSFLNGIYTPRQSTTYKVS